MDKREFLRDAGTAAIGFMLAADALARHAATPAAALATNEDFWAAVRGRFRLRDEVINLENGYYCFQPEEVLEAFIGNVRSLNFEASHYMRTRRDDDRVAIRVRLAEFVGCSPDDLIVTRNTTESLDTVISGIDWKSGDEAVMANQDYGAMLDMFRLQAQRHGIRNRVIDVPMDPASDAEVVDAYARALTPRTRLLMVSHIVNITGQVLPVSAICDMAHARGVPVMVDGAHAIAHLHFRLADLGCDYYGASLHKWLSAPLGAGLLYVRRDRIRELWPIYADSSVAPDDIRKLNHTGTHPEHTPLTIARAIEFHDAIGGTRKEARLRFLQQYWTTQLRGRPGVVFSTPSDPDRCCAIATVGLENRAPAQLAEALLKDYKIYTVAIDTAGVRGVRVTPQVYTSTTELDVLVKALRELSA